MRLENRNNYIKIFVVVGPILLAWTVLFFIKIFSPATQLVGADELFSYHVYTDKELKGNSEANATLSDHHTILFD